MDHLNWQIASSEERQTALDGSQRVLDVFVQTPGERILFDLKLIEMRRRKESNPIWAALQSVKDDISDERYQSLESTIMSELRVEAQRVIQAMPS